jgi:hypothetical protein
LWSKKKHNLFPWSTSIDRSPAKIGRLQAVRQSAAAAALKLQVGRVVERHDDGGRLEEKSDEGAALA